MVIIFIIEALQNIITLTEGAVLIFFAIWG